MTRTSVISDADLSATLKAKIDTADLVLMLAGANASTFRVAPCLAEDDVDDFKLAEAKLILLGALNRWSTAGAGSIIQESQGPFSRTIDSRNSSGYRLWPTEIEQLQDVCSSDGQSVAFFIDTAPSLSGEHAPWCNLAFGALYCSCGTDIAGYPIYEGE